MDVVGVEYVISAEREAGKSLRRTRVSCRWCVEGWEVVLWEEREMDHASPARKRVLAVEMREVDDDGMSALIRFLRVVKVVEASWRSSGW